MDITLDDIGPAILGLGLIGLFVMIVMPREWQNWQGWLIVSYAGLPAFLVVCALLVNIPGLLIGGMFLLGILAMGKR